MRKEYIDFSKINKANVYLRDEVAGILEKLSEDQYVFTYTADWFQSGKADIATSFPLSTSPNVSKKLHPFFDNLIAEGWLLGYAEKAFHIDKSNRFAMLLATGESTIGAVSIKPIVDNKEISLHSYYKEELSESDLSAYKVIYEKNELCPYCLGELGEKDKKNFHLKCAREMWGTTRDISIYLEPKKPLNSFTKTVYGGSISGAQRKGLFTLKGNKLYPMSYGSQYILKPNGDYDELPENEHVTMVIAKRLGFNVPPVVILDVDGTGQIYAVKRFDFEKGNSLKKEDMAQILGAPSEDKYDSSCERVANAIASLSSAPKIDLNDFWRRLLFCFVTANGDMHLKNWSLLESKKLNNNWELAPCYDLLNTRIPIPKESLDIGLTILGKKRNLQKSYFIKFAQKYKLDEKFIEKTFAEISEWLEVIKETIPKSYLSEDSKDRYIELAEERVSILIS